MLKFCITCYENAECFSAFALKVATNSEYIYRRNHRYYTRVLTNDDRVYMQTRFVHIITLPTSSYIKIYLENLLVMWTLNQTA